MNQKDKLSLYGYVLFFLNILFIFPRLIIIFTFWGVTGFHGSDTFLPTLITLLFETSEAFFIFIPLAILLMKKKKNWLVISGFKHIFIVSTILSLLKIISLEHYSFHSRMIIVLYILSIILIGFIMRELLHKEGDVSKEIKQINQENSEVEMNKMQREEKINLYNTLYIACIFSVVGLFLWLIFGGFATLFLSQISFESMIKAFSMYAIYGIVLFSPFLSIRIYKKHIKEDSSLMIEEAMYGIGWMATLSLSGLFLTLLNSLGLIMVVLIYIQMKHVLRFKKLINK